MTKNRLQVRKHQLVRNAIYDAAMRLFAVKGFDETTVEEVAQASGVSRRSFFRYFASKDDVLAQNVLHYGDVLTAAVAAGPAGLTPFETVRETILTVVKQTAGQAHTRQVIDIAERSASARQAHTSKMREVEDSVAAAYAARLKSPSNYDVKPRLLATLTLSVMNVAIMAWYRGEYQDLSDAANQVFSNLAHFICDKPSSTHLKEPIETKRNLISRPTGDNPASRKSRDVGL